jgi:hypothetical protein
MGDDGDQNDVDKNDEDDDKYDDRGGDDLCLLATAMTNAMNGC